MKKTRSDALLKNLPPERQEQIIDWCDTPKTEDTPGGYQLAREQLAADGLQVSLRALSDFYSWYQLKQVLAMADADAEEASNWMRDFKPGDEEAARKFGEFIFLQKAVRTQDAEIFTAATMARDMRVGMEGKAVIDKAKLEIAERKVAQKSQEISLAREKFRRDTAELFVEWFEKQQAQEIMKSGASKADKIEALGQAMFGEDW